MGFSLFKKHLHRTTILVFILFIIAIIIGVAIVGGTGTFTKPEVKVPAERFVAIILDGLIMALVIWILHMSQSFVSLGYVITKKQYITKEKKTTIIKFTNPWWLHLLTACFLIAIYFLTITGLMYAYDNSWVKAARHNWWIVLIIFVVNFAIIEFAYNLNLYKFNHDPEITNEI